MLAGIPLLWSLARAANRMESMLQVGAQTCVLRCTLVPRSSRDLKQPFLCANSLKSASAVVDLSQQEPGTPHLTWTAIQQG
jgi:hypothetical protein